MPEPLPVLCLAGPTGAGKTALALELAKTLHAEVVNADSRQVYADFPLITAQPDASERAVCPHHLYGWLATEESLDVQRWITRALACATDIRARGKLPLLVGGTGMYFHSLLHGIAAIPPVDPAIHEALRARLAAEGPAGLHAELKALDPELAARLHPNDSQRIVRGLEVCQSSGRPLSWWHANAQGQPACAGPLLAVRTPLPELEPGLRARIDGMIERGALDEGRRALARCPDGSAPGWSGIGCREVRDFLLGRLSLDEAKAVWFQRTRAYAKRQITWFRGRSETVWLDPDDSRTALAVWERFAEGLARP